MTTQQFLKLVEQECVEPILDKYDIERDYLEVIQVWYCKTIQNHKGLFILKQNETIQPYFVECTYNGDDKELYLDFYTNFYTKKFKHTERIE